MKQLHKLLFATSLLLLTGCSSRFNPGKHETVFERSAGTQTVTYEEGIEWWKQLDDDSPFVKLVSFGETDAGLPLHLVIVSADQNFSRERAHEKQKTIWLINNGIHPGEPDGIDASMLFVRDLLAADSFKETYANTLLLIIPFYNVGGALQRNCCSRANQDGPESYGFRGNARNLDLNRDFMKTDSKNAQSFQQLFQEWNPDVYLETHVSNGADYQYTMTYLCSQPDKLGLPLGSFVRETLNPALYDAMSKRGEDMIPYVNLFSLPPDSGYAAFYDSPRYSTGFTALHHSIGLLTETHMLKPFTERVEATRTFMHVLGDYITAHGEEIQQQRQLTQEEALRSAILPIDWVLDSSSVQPLPFKGYTAYYDTSSVTGQAQLYYDRERPFEKDVPYIGAMKPRLSVEVPLAYLVPRGWSRVVDLLQTNGVEMQLIAHDTALQAVAYEIVNYATAKQPYEGHYFHYDVEVEKQYLSQPVMANQWYLVPTSQPRRRFIVEALEPQGPDSYFNWNFYDEILQQKEGFSAYVFDEEAKQLLAENEGLARQFEAMKASDPHFAESAFLQLYFLYRNSDHYERDHHMIYPVLRIE